MCGHFGNGVSSITCMGRGHFEDVGKASGRKLKRMAQVSVGDWTKDNDIQTSVKDL